MGKVCMSCYESYGNEISLLNSYKDEDGIHYTCPKRSCYGEIVDIDDILVPTIILLNEKGYYTTASCSGHLEEVDTSCYIMFDETVEKLPSAPPGFTLTAAITNSGDKILTLSKEFNTVPSAIHAFQQILTTALQLYGWALSLPYAEIGGVEVFYADEGFFKDFFENGKQPEKEESNPIDPEKLKKDITSSTITMDDFIGLLNKDKKKKKEKDKNKED